MVTINNGVRSKSNKLKRERGNMITVISCTCTTKMKVQIFLSPDHKVEVYNLIKKKKINIFFSYHPQSLVSVTVTPYPEEVVMVVRFYLKAKRDKYSILNKLNSSNFFCRYRVR